MHFLSKFSEKIIRLKYSVWKEHVFIINPQSAL